MNEERNILIVDSDVAFSTILKEGLEQEARYRTVVTSTGREALDALDADKFDLVIIDLGLDDPHGPAFVRDLREQKPDLNLMLIPVMGESLPPKLSDLDIQGILTKPFFFPELPSIIGQAMGEEISEEPAEDAVPTPTDEMPEEKTSLDWGAITSRGGAAKDKPLTSLDEGPDKDLNEALDEALDEYDVGLDAEHAERLRRIKGRISERDMQKIMQAMNSLAEDINADAVILTCGGGLIAHAGPLTVNGARDLACLVGENWCASLRIAEILGQQQRQFEQSIDGGDHLFYSFAVDNDIVLSTVLSASVPLGMIRHSTKSTAAKLKRLLQFHTW